MQGPRLSNASRLRAGPPFGSDGSSFDGMGASQDLGRPSCSMMDAISEEAGEEEEGGETEEDMIHRIALIKSATHLSHPFTNTSRTQMIY